MLTAGVDSWRTPTGGANRLRQLLGPGALDCCMDLFLLDAGPGLRGKLAHGDVRLACYPSETPPTGGEFGEFAAPKGESAEEGSFLGRYEGESVKGGAEVGPCF